MFLPIPNLHFSFLSFSCLLRHSTLGGGESLPVECIHFRILFSDPPPLPIRPETFLFEFIPREGLFSCVTPLNKGNTLHGIRYPPTARLFPSPFSTFMFCTQVFFAEPDKKGSFPLVLFFPQTVIPSPFLLFHLSKLNTYYVLFSNDLLLMPRKEMFARFFFSNGHLITRRLLFSREGHSLFLLPFFHGIELQGLVFPINNLRLYPCFPSWLPSRNAPPPLISLFARSHSPF